jgi:hypothetical protein
MQWMMQQWSPFSVANNNSFGHIEFVRSKGEGGKLFKLSAKHIH